MTHSPWQASIIEQRTAWAVAACSLILILTAASQPQWFELATPAQHNTPQQTKHVATKAVAQPKAVQTTAKKPAHSSAVAPIKQQASKPKARSKPVASTKKNHIPPPAKTNLTAPGFYVQIGAFKAQDRAQRLKNKLTKQGWHAHIMHRKSALHAIWIGPKSTHHKAEQLLKTIQRKLHYKGFIVQNKRG